MIGDSASGSASGSGSATAAKAVPFWQRKGMERPAGTKDMGGWTRAVYTAEQQARLGVDENGAPEEAEAAKKLAEAANAAGEAAKKAGEEVCAFAHTRARASVRSCVRACTNKETCLCRSAYA